MSEYKTGVWIMAIFCLTFFSFAALVVVDDYLAKNHKEFLLKHEAACRTTAH